jgi:hypothetical protein
LEAFHTFEFGNLLDKMAGNKRPEMTLQDSLEKCVYFARFALHFNLDPAIDQILNPTDDFVASRQFLDRKSKSHPLNPTFVNDAPGDHKFDGGTPSPPGRR